MTDYGYPLRQAWIKSSHPLAIKLAELRERMHKQNCFFLGEEILAKRSGGKVFDRFKGWKS